jgi:glycerophosphoryl diester phosphodiesterase
MTAITGHRGCHGLWPENSLTGFREAAKLGCDAIEFDVHLTRAGELIVMHDPTLERTTEGTGEVAALLPEDRADTRLKDSIETIPTLDDVLEVLAPSGVNLHVEIKRDAAGHGYPGISGLVADRLQAHGVAARSHLTSFDITALKECQRLNPEIRRLVSADAAWVDKHGGLEAFFADAADLADIVALRHDYFFEFFDQVTQLWPKDRLCVWTINTPDLVREWLSRGIGHLTTDDPALALMLRTETAK